MASPARRVLITGGTGGIGRATAQLFAERGSDVIVTGRNETPGRQVAAETDGRFIRADLTSLAEVRRLAAEAGTVDILVHNAGYWELRPTADYLASDEARPITGTVLAVDAGQVATL